MYTGYLLSESSRQKLLSSFPPKHPDVICHHVTERFGVVNGEPVPTQPESFVVIGYANDDGIGVEGLLVEVNGTINRPHGGLYHITLSIDKSKGAKSYLTNSVIHSATPVQPIRFEATAKLFQF